MKLCIDETKISVTEQYVELSENAIFECFGNKLVWYFNDGDLPANTAQYDDGTLGIYDVGLSNEGYYVCRGEHYFRSGVFFYSRGLLNVYGRNNSKTKLSICKNI